MEYNLTREQAAKILWISTRTLDRRIRKWILSHEKRWNKVYLAEEEVKNYNKHKEVSNVVYQSTVSSNIPEQSTNLSTNFNQEELISEISKHMEKNMDKFLKILIEKDKQLEEKNKIIFALQHKVGELETKLKNTVALPLYQEEKEELILEKENLKIENKLLSEKLQKEKIKNIVIIWVLIVFVIILIFFVSK